MDIEPRCWCNSSQSHTYPLSSFTLHHLLVASNRCCCRRRSRRHHQASTSSYHHHYYHQHHLHQGSEECGAWQKQKLIDKFIENVRPWSWSRSRNLEHLYMWCDMLCDKCNKVWSVYFSSYFCSFLLLLLVCCNVITADGTLCHCFVVMTIFDEKCQRVGQTKQLADRKCSFTSFVLVVGLLAAPWRWLNIKNKRKKVLKPLLKAD